MTHAVNHTTRVASDLETDDQGNLRTTAGSPVPATSGSVTEEIEVTTDGVYAANDIVGGIIEIEDVNFAAGRDVTLGTLHLNDAGNNAAELHIHFFKETPADGTYANNGPVTWGAGDSERRVGFVKVLAEDWVSDGSQCTANLSRLAEQMAVEDTSLFMLIITPDAPDYQAGELTIKLGFKQE